MWFVCFWISCGVVGGFGWVLWVVDCELGNCLCWFVVYLEVWLVMVLDFVGVVMVDWVVLFVLVFG